jgi:hypothetical protein
MYVTVSNKFCDFSLLHWPLFRWKVALIPLYNPLQSPMGAYVHKTTYGPLHNTALYIMLLMRVNQLFWAPNGTHLTDTMPFHSAQKSLDFQDPTPYHLPS